MTYTEFKASVVAKTRMDEFVSMIQKKKNYTYLLHPLKPATYKTEILIFQVWLFWMRYLLDFIISFHYIFHFKEFLRLECDRLSK